MRELFLAAVLAGVAFGARAQVESNQSFPLIERGRYLATVGDCTACHTRPDGKLLAGGRAIETPFGKLISPNITPDKETGIGAWDDDTFIGAMQRGYTHEYLYPAMPYPYYTKATREDVLAIRAYLNTVEPVANHVVSNQLPFPFSVRAAMAGWNALYFKEGRWQDHADKSAEWNRGGYLVEGLGHCGACHTPKNMFGGDEDSQHLQGYVLQGWYAPNITGDTYNGIGRWSVDDIVEYLKTGMNRFQTASGPMAEEISDSSQHWTIADLRAASVYLKDQPGQDRKAPAAVAANDPVMQAGSAIYVDQCAACHTLSGAGIARMFPALKDSSAVLSDHPASLLRVVISGTRAVATTTAPTAPAMPSFGWKLNDDQIASVLTYVRNAWGNAGAPISAGDVKSARSDLGKPAD